MACDARPDKGRQLPESLNSIVGNLLYCSRHPETGRVLCSYHVLVSDQPEDQDAFDMLEIRLLHLCSLQIRTGPRMA